MECSDRVVENSETCCYCHTATGMTEYKLVVVGGKADPPSAKGEKYINLAMNKGDIFLLSYKTCVIIPYFISTDF